ncbi:MAG: DegT/DnrJ/EryC1/StrS family aminotransferase [Armatimonadetes bacterium]|nr:DegT/DnrJ/EryC1/StrS family aminotransferase [Armatimonadota bacterium]
MKLPIVRPVFDKDDLDLIQKPLETGWVVQGPYVKEFEEKIAGYVGARYAVAVNSCTSGQFIMSRIVDLKPGDEVIVPSFTWISTVNSIEFLGATAVFCDIGLRSFNIDVNQIRGKITPRTKAIYPVHLFGLPAPMPEILRIAKEHNLQVVEDCACALGARIEGAHCGSFGLAGILSFHPRKSITTGEGGMIVTNDDRTAAMAVSLRDHGAVKSDFSRHNERGSFLLSDYAHLGYNVRMTDIQGALGVAQFKKIGWILQKKQDLAKMYNERLAEIPWLAPPEAPPGYTHGYQTYCTLFKPEEALKAVSGKDQNAIERLHEERNEYMAHLEGVGIATRQGTHAVHVQRLYREKYKIHAMAYPVSYAADRLSLALPFFPTITPDEIDWLFEQLKKMRPKRASAGFFLTGRDHS